jgi:hypothetical protein
METFASLRDRNIDGPNGPQADLEHERVAKDGRGGRGGIGVGGDVVGGEHEAVVDIARADDVLVDLVGDQIPAGGALSDPVVGDLDRARDQDALAAGQIAQIRLGGVVGGRGAARVVPQLNCVSYCKDRTTDGLACGANCAGTCSGPVCVI